jgi:hypothetical protein
MAYMGMFHSDESLREYEDEFFGDDIEEGYYTDEDEETDEDRYEEYSYEYFYEEEDDFDLWLGGM